MAEFKKFQKAIQQQFSIMLAYPLFRTAVTKDELWDEYLASFSDEHNPKFRERAEHDCQCCRQFIRAVGNMVAIDNNNRTMSIWDVIVPKKYQETADHMRMLVIDRVVENAFFHYESKVGAVSGVDTATDIIWNHFNLLLPDKFVKLGDDLGGMRSESRACFDVLKRSLIEIESDAINTVLELIEQNSLARGAEHKRTVTTLQKCKHDFDGIISKDEQDNYCWLASIKLGQASKIRNTVIGTLLIDLSEGEDLNSAVDKFECKVAGENYKRPKALITESMRKAAEKDVTDLGFMDSLPRRPAVMEDVSVNDVLFADRSAKKEMNGNAFDDLKKDVKTNVKKLDKVERIMIDDFVRDVLPHAETLEVMLENRQVNNLMTLIAPLHPDALNMLKWKNNFSWVYNGEFADSIKERVKKAGGNVNAYLGWRLGWFNYDDLDIHAVEPNGNEIEFGTVGRTHLSTGILDVDMNAGGRSTRTPVENIVWTNKNKMQEGVYKIFVRQFSKRESKDVGFAMEMEFNGETRHFHYDKPLSSKEDVLVAEYKWTKAKGIEMIKSLSSDQASQEIWCLPTEQFHRVKMVTLSPNFWDEQTIGNKHYFFILDGCKNGESTRGFFNEFLNDNLHKHRKVFEMLGARMRVEPSDEQISGLGFSSTMRNHVFCKVTGSFTRTIKIMF